MQEIQKKRILSHYMEIFSCEGQDSSQCEKKWNFTIVTLRKHGIYMFYWKNSPGCEGQEIWLFLKISPSACWAGSTVYIHVQENAYCKNCWKNIFVFIAPVYVLTMHWLIEFQYEACFSHWIAFVLHKKNFLLGNTRHTALRTASDRGGWYLNYYFWQMQKEATK
jgi:hypothetical protein